MVAYVILTNRINKSELIYSPDLVRTPMISRPKKRSKMIELWVDQYF